MYIRTQLHQLTRYWYLHAIDAASLLKILAFSRHCIRLLETLVFASIFHDLFKPLMTFQWKFLLSSALQQCNTYFGKIKNAGIAIFKFLHILKIILPQKFFCCANILWGKSIYIDISMTPKIFTHNTAPDFSMHVFSALRHNQSPAAATCCA